MATAPDYINQPETHPTSPKTSQTSSDHKTTKSPDPRHYKYEDCSWQEEGAEEGKELALKTWPQGLELYTRQDADAWPSSGKHILASYDDRSIVVYQAFCPAIAQAAVKNQKFGGGGFSFTRMSWIKTNFLWMMYRCGWATKPKQERVLAVRISLEGFNHILAEATSVEFQKSQGLKDCKVRLQWDPDHTPTGEKKARRAIQLGLKDEILMKYCTEWIVSITDVTPFVQYQHNVLQKRGNESVSIPLERVYIPPSQATRQRIGLS
ncbi:hypothetical protein ACOMHN_035702 [Nucella lapillus]